MVRASVPDPVAPAITVPLPDGWTSAAGSGDVALTSTGPGNASARVTITPTDLDPAGAFVRYAADLRTRRPGGKGTVDFADRITFARLRRGEIHSDAAVCGRHPLKSPRFGAGGR